MGGNNLQKFLSFSAFHPIQLIFLCFLSLSFITTDWNCRLQKAWLDKSHVGLCIKVSLHSSWVFFLRSSCMGYSIPLKVFFCKFYFNCSQCFEFCSVLNDFQLWKNIWITKFVKDFEVYPREEKSSCLLLFAWKYNFSPFFGVLLVFFLCKSDLDHQAQDDLCALSWRKQNSSGETYFL